MTTETHAVETCFGWGKATSARARVARPDTLDALKRCIADSAEHGGAVALRAGGNSYGDLITNSDGLIIDLCGFDRIVADDFDAGTVTVEPGVPLGRLVDHCLAKGWVPRAVPGSPFVTVGGAIANNVHGKDSFAKGNFGDGVLSMRVLLADGNVVTANADENRDLFEAVIGGLGLCGIVIEATLKLEHVPSGFLDVEMIRFDDADAMVGLFEESARNWDMLVAWVDAFDRDGRGVLERGRWRGAPADGRIGSAMPERDTGATMRRTIGRICRPFTGRWSFRLLNALFFHALPIIAGRKTRHFSGFNFIVTSRIPEPPDLYPGGMIEVQVLVPKTAAGNTVRRIFALCRDHAQESWWCGVKMHEGHATPLSFTGSGFSLSVNLPGRNMHGPGFGQFLDALVGLVSETNGRVYIGKDQVLQPGHIETLFPDAAKFIAAKRRFDPAGIFQSDLARRLFLK